MCDMYDIKKFCHILISTGLVGLYVIGFLSIWDYTEEPIYMIVYGLFGFWLIICIIIGLFQVLGLHNTRRDYDLII